MIAISVSYLTQQSLLAMLEAVLVPIIDYPINLGALLEVWSITICFLLVLLMSTTSTGTDPDRANNIKQLRKLMTLECIDAARVPILFQLWRWYMNTEQILADFQTALPLHVPGFILKVVPCIVTSGCTLNILFGLSFLLLMNPRTMLLDLADGVARPLDADEPMLEVLDPWNLIYHWGVADPEAEVVEQEQEDNVRVEPGKSSITGRWNRRLYGNMPHEISALRVAGVNRSHDGNYVKSITMANPCPKFKGHFTTIRAEEDQDDTLCQVCLATYEAGETLLRLPCEHLVHRECIETWWEKKLTCVRCTKNFEWILAEKRLSCQPCRAWDEELPEQGLIPD